MKSLLASVFIVACGAVLAASSGACGARTAIQRETAHGGSGGASLDDGGVPDAALDGGGADADGGDAAPCVPQGEECLQPTDCCSNECNVKGTCGPVQCRKEFYFCFSNEDCCNSQCTHLAPTLDLCYVCITTGFPCSDAGVPCCSGACNPENRCWDPPP